MSSDIQFAVVGASGVLVNLAVLTPMVAAGFPAVTAVVTEIAVSMVTNFLPKRQSTFSYSRSGPNFPQFIGFAPDSAAGAGLNLASTLLVLTGSRKLDQLNE